MNPKIDAYFDSVQNWQQELEKLRTIILDCGLTEELKWGLPCYTFENTNVVILNPLKEYCALGFFKGALLYDANDILQKPGEHTQAVRLIRFTRVKEIAAMESVLKAYIYEAIELERADLHVKLKKTSEYDVPEEFQRRLNKNPALKNAFEALTPGRQRGYLLHFSAPKQSETRESRIEKCIPLILKGKGLNDDFNDKKRMPRAK
jgi:uncharacterized protein YdeI (YjbR/CyaY-like superfamily)